MVSTLLGGMLGSQAAGFAGPRMVPRMLCRSKECATMLPMPNRSRLLRFPEGTLINHRYLLVSPGDKIAAGSGVRAACSTKGAEVEASKAPKSLQVVVPSAVTLQAAMSRPWGTAAPASSFLPGRWYSCPAAGRRACRVPSSFTCCRPRWPATATRASWRPPTRRICGTRSRISPVCSTPIFSR